MILCTIVCLLLFFMRLLRLLSYSAAKFCHSEHVIKSVVMYWLLSAPIIQFSFEVL